MKLALTFLLAALAVCQICADVPAFTIDREYRYAYKGRSVTGLAGDIMQFSGLGIKGNIIIQNRGKNLYFMFTDLQYGQFNDKVYSDMEEEFEMPYTPIVGPHTFVKEALSMPFRVTVEKGLVKSFDVYTEDPEWSVNVKRAILSLFQLNFDRVNPIRFSKSNYLKHDDSSDFFRVMEDGIGGECETIYEINSQPYYKYPNEQVLNVTKHRNYEKCVNRPSNFFSTHHGYKCDSCKHLDPLQTISRTEYEIHGDRHYHTIEKIYNIGKYLFTPFSTNSETVFSGVNQTLILTETSSIKEPIQFRDNYLTFTSLTYNTTADYNSATGEVDLKQPNYYNHHFDYKYNNYKEKIAEYLDALSHMHEINEDFIEKDYPGKVAQLVKIFGSLTFDELVEVYITHVKFSLESMTYEAVQKKKMFFETLIATGTNPTVSFIIHALKTYQDPTLHSTFTRFPFYIKEYSEALIDLVYNFAKDMNKHKDKNHKTFWLGFGTMIHYACSEHHNNKHHIRSDTCKRYVKLVYDHFDSTSEWEMELALKVLGNMGLPESYTYLKPIATGEKQYSLRVRKAALYALYGSSEVLREEVVTIAVPIYFNYSEPLIIRLAAFEIIMSINPSYDALQSLADRLHSDPSHQMVSYVYSTYRAYANSTNPCDREIGEKTARVLQTIPEYFYGYHYSQKFFLNYYNDKFNFGGETLISYVGSNESIIPEYVYLEQSKNILGYNMDLFAVEFEGVGFSKLYKKLYDLYDPRDENKSVFNLFRRLPRNVDTNKKERDEITNNLHIANRDTQPIEGGLTFWMFNREIAYYYMDEKTYFPSFRDTGNFYLHKELPKHMLNGMDFNFQSAYMIADVNYEIPTELGFPLSFHFQYPGYSSIMSNVKLHVEPGFFPEDRDYKKPSSVMLSVTGKTMSHVKVTGEVAVKTPIMNSYGVGVTHDILMNYPLNVDVDYNLKKKKFHINYEPSQTKYQMFALKTYPFTFIDKRTNYVPAAKEPLSQPIHYKTEPEEMSFSVGQDYYGAGLTYYEKHEYPWSDFGSYYKFLGSFFTQKGRTFDAYNYAYNIFHRILPAYSHMRHFFSLPPQPIPAEMKISYEPDKENPVTMYDTFIQYKKYEKTATKDPLPPVTEPKVVTADKTFRKHCSVSMDVTAKGKTGDRKYYSEYVEEYDADDMLRHVALKYTRTPLPGYDTEPFELCLNADAELPEYEDWYSIDKELAKKAEITYNITFGKSCKYDGVSKIDMKIIAEKSDEEKERDADNTLYPTYDVCTEQQKQGYNMSDDCWELFMEYYNVRKYTTDIHYENLPQSFSNFMNKMSYWVKYYFFTNIDHVDQTDKTPAGHIKVVSNYSVDKPTMDISVYRPDMHIHYKNIYYPKYFPWMELYNLRYDQNEKLMDKIFYYSHRPTCFTQKGTFYTFDSVSFNYTAPKNCYYVLAKDCSNNDKFSVLVKDVEHTTLKKALKVFVLNNKIEILPLDTTQPPVLRINDVVTPFPRNSVYLFPNPDSSIRLMFKIVYSGSSYTIESSVVGLEITFNGEFVGVTVSNAYRGITCGLCGNLNGEETNEFVGPKGCVYNSDKAFGYSYVVPDSSCPIPTGLDQTCIDPYAPKYKGECTIRRNKLIYNVATDSKGIQSNNVCFSTTSIPQCAPGCKAAGGQYFKRQMGFHCLNTDDRSTSQLVSRSKIEELELKNKREDHHEIIQYPESCVKA